MAASLKRELGIEVETVEGHYAEFTVLVDGERVVNGGWLAFLGVLPSVRAVREIVKRKLGEGGR